jgi:hypothetical protein
MRRGSVLAALLLVWLLRLGAVQQTTSQIQKAVEEFKIQTRNLGLRADSPRKTRRNGAATGWHGRLFENFRNDFLDAVPHENRQVSGDKGVLRRNQFGFNLAGPLVIPRLYHGRGTFFSLSYEGVRENIARSYLRTIPTLPERVGDFSAVVDKAGDLLPIYDPESTRLNPAFSPTKPVSLDNLQYNRNPFPLSRIPANRLDPVAQKALAFYPAPNTNIGPFFQNNYFILSPETNTADGMIAKLEQSIKDRHRLALGLSFSNGLAGAAKWFPTIANPGPTDRIYNSRRASLEHVFTASPRNINTFSFVASTSSYQNSVETDENGRPFPVYRMEPYLSMGRSYPISRTARNYFELNDSFSTRSGKHALRAVGEYSWEQVNSFWPQYPSGHFQFSPGLTSLPGIVNTGHAFASFLLGQADFAESSVVLSPSYFRRNRATLALRDQYEAWRGLTLHLGVNLDISTPRVEKYNRQSTVDLTSINPVNGRPGALVAAGQEGRGSAFQPNRFRLEPRASLSWSPGGNPKNVIRLSFSRSYSSIPIYSGQWGTQGFNGNPTFVSPNVQLEPAVTLSEGLPPLEHPLPDLRPEAVNNTIADLIDPTDRQPVYQHSSLSIEREIPGSIVVTVGASHSGGENLLVSNSAANPNAIPLSALDYRDQLNDEEFNRSLRPFPQYQRFDVYSSYPIGRYQRDEGYVRLEKRTSGGLSLTAYYEFSKQMDDYSGPYGTQDYYNRDNEWSLTSYNNPHRLSLSYMYELPFGPNKPFLAVTDWRRFLVEGWSLSGITTISSGEPIALKAQFDNTGNVVDALRVNAVPGVNPHVSNQSPDLWFNPAAFVNPPDFTVGNVSRTHPSLRTPLQQNHDVSLTKRFALTGDRAVEFSAVGFNFINHANWNDPDTEIGTAAAPNVNAGRIIGSHGGRVIQLGLRFSF